MDKDINQLRPWVRFWVRNLDLILFFLLIRGILWNNLLFLGEHPFVRLFIIGLFMILVEATFIFLFRKTPGKWIGNIKVKNFNGDNLTFIQALRRTLLVWVTGTFLNIPFLSFITMWLSRNSLTKKGITYWDEVCKTNVEHNSLPIWRYAIIIIIGILFNLIVYISTIDYLLSLTMKFILW